MCAIGPSTPLLDQTSTIQQSAAFDYVVCGSQPLNLIYPWFRLTPQCCVKSRKVQASNPSSQCCIFHRPISFNLRSTGHSPIGHLNFFSTTLTKPASSIMFLMSGAIMIIFPNFWLASIASSEQRCIMSPGAMESSSAINSGMGSLCSM